MSHQDKHLRDIRAMLALSPELIDLGFLDHWTETHGLSVIWRQCRSRVGEA